MLIHCTKRACERLKITPPVVEKEYNPLYSWRLNVVEEGRRRLVVFMNDASRYCVTLDGIKANDWSKLLKIFTERLREIMLAEQINPDIIERYFSEAGEVEYFRNNDRQMTSWLNKACEAACLGYETRDGYIIRNIIVPAKITFEQLVNVIKRAYDWWDYKNQYHFLLYSDKGFPELYLREERDPSTFDLSIFVMAGVRLSEYIPKYKMIRFLYDYREDWSMLINLTADYDNYIGDIPCLKSGMGNAPPEGVGGADGYAEFLDKLKNGTYAERQERTRWGKYHGYEEFNLEKVNRIVERSLK